MRKYFLMMVGLVFITACSVPPYDGDSYQQQAEMGQQFNHFNHIIAGRTISGVHSGVRDSKLAVLFIHGAPGDWKAWGRYLGDEDLNQKTFMIAVDRLGYAGSGAGDEETDLALQTQSIMTAALKEHTGPFVVVSHSYGGPIALQVAIDYPDNIQANILLAGAIDPSLHQARWYHKWANSALLKTILPGPMNVATQEMLALPNGLTKQKPLLQTIQSSTLVIQGEKDWLVPSGNVTYAEDNLTQATVETITLPGQGHFLPWEQYDLVKQTILEHLDR